ncbi:NFX1-type zinc finger-containing protein 1 [Tolypocladium ophioglossoides CBS 100239]|uniref:NFX1-type zinc finger-containing protein 1 n=1 Tax=Tolypocladium ophioglossoides (strain CBS 100239) TaxID=1163406 RepID=A0A0L0MZV8_TOLOC|nr:NFX1-type zinc finger-containing protein 1 [Tolypocladium ophioglossoides CBS 100239]
MATVLSGRDRVLNRLFRSNLSGESSIKGPQDAKHFLEAIDAICKQKTPAVCVESIVSSAKGIETVRSVVRSDLSRGFVSSVMALLVTHLSDPPVKIISDGEFLKRLLVAILSPPTFWSALFVFYRADSSNHADAEIFAWLCLEIVSMKSPDLEVPYQDVVSLMNGKSLLASPSHPVRQLAYRIEKVLKLHSIAATASTTCGPGGRHDNDFTDFRSISIFPTADEILSADEPFLQRLDDVFSTSRESLAATYLEWLFRLLREDMLADLREDLCVAWGQKKGKRSTLRLGKLSLVGFGGDDKKRVDPFSVSLQCEDGIVFPRGLDQKAKKKFLENTKSFVKHNSLGALCRNNDIVAFGSIVRNNEQLLTAPPTIVIKFTSAAGLKNAIEALLSQKQDELKFFVVDTATFAYEPILQRLQAITEIPMEDTLLDPKTAASIYQPPERLSRFLEQLKSALKKQKEVDLSSLVQMGRPVRISGAQLESLINGLGNAVGQIQGPPGTGKSFIGALISQIILKLTNHRILVLSYTNHALDQFLEDLLDIGVAGDSMVRLGSKSTVRTDSLRLEKQPKYQFSFEVNAMIRRYKEEAVDVNKRLADLGSKLGAKRVAGDDILVMLEFLDGGDFWKAFQVPKPEDGFKIVGKNNKRLQPKEVLETWAEGGSSTTVQTLMAYMDPMSRHVWGLPLPSRSSLFDHWSNQVRQEQMAEFLELAQTSHEIQRQIDILYNDSKRKVVQNKRVIGCTTTAAAMYQSIIKSAEPDVVLVEEAGEILEAHVITALSPSVKQLVLIGDHKQLRPKVSNYKLTVEKGEGFNLNMSLFERLIHQGYDAYTVLREQHRSHPDISYFARHLAYDYLQDNPKTEQREKVRGVDGRVIFVHHEHHEKQLNNVDDPREGESKTSKENAFEARMVIKMVRYLSQQGYKSENIVVLTPYLGQLSLLRQKLSDEHDPLLNDLDSHELIHAGLMTQTIASVSKRPIRLSTIDNYQGEESDIVVASLTRSNPSGDIGFMSARERLVVLMSRARNCIILFGNMHTFMKSKKGGELWKNYLLALKDKGCLFDGVPVHCQQHPDRSALLKSPEDFDQHCPDGGCAEPCGEKLSCGSHPCELRCHRATDHSKILCRKLLPKTCDRGHKTKVPCSNKRSGCKACAREDEETRRRALRDFELEKTRQEQQDAYARELQAIDDEIDRHQRATASKMEAERQQKELGEKKAQLQSLKDAKARSEAAAKRSDNSAMPGAWPNTGNGNSGAGPGSKSKAGQEWAAMKAQGESNKALDELMSLIGLESVKEEFLSIKSSIETKIRQGVLLSEERLSCTLLGNPGTVQAAILTCPGKTTVARLLGQFLASTGVLPGSGFKETTGSKLANSNVSGCEKLIEDLKNAGGGVLFIDEAYQLSSGNSPGGKAVLDYLLAEVENLRGKIVFVIAGYAKQMESFFAHNPGFPSRFPIQMKFEDYSDDELLEILQRQVNRKFKGRMAIEDGYGGLFFRIFARRVGRGRGKEGFGNARAVENALARVEKRQANRLRRERRSGGKPNDWLFTKEDIIGPEPSMALSSSKAWRKLNEMIGLQEVKQEVKVLLDSITTNYERELAEEPLMTFSLNRVFIGSPGTGKTTVAKLYGEILASLGLLSNGEVVVKTPADFVGAVLGGSEEKTKGILASTVGKVLVIDEASGLDGGDGGNGSFVDRFRVAVVDTIVAEVQNVPGDDRCVILLGYKEQMERMFQNVNPGLSRRFAIDSPFVFQDFDDGALQQILDLKLKNSGFNVTGQAKQVAMEVLGRERNRPNFGNGGAIDNLLSKAKVGYQKRASAGIVKRSQLEAIDFDEKFDRGSRTETNVQQLFADDVGREKVVAMLQEVEQKGKAFDISCLQSPSASFQQEVLDLLRSLARVEGWASARDIKQLGKVIF